MLLVLIDFRMLHIEIVEHRLQRRCATDSFLSSNRMQEDMEGALPGEHPLIGESSPHADSTHEVLVWSAVETMHRRTDGPKWTSAA